MGHCGEVRGTGLDGYRTGQKAREELLSKMTKLREEEQETKDDACNDSSTLNKKTDGKMIKVERDDTNKTSKGGGGKSWKGWTGKKKSNQ